MESFKFVEPIFVVCQFLKVRGDVIGWGQGWGVGGLKGNITSEKLILLEISYLSLQWLVQWSI